MSSVALSREYQLNLPRAVVEYMFEIPSHLNSMDQAAQHSQWKCIAHRVHNGSAALNL